MPETSSNFEAQEDRLMDDYASPTYSVSEEDIERQFASYVKRYQKLVLATTVISLLLCVMVLAIAVFVIFQESDHQAAIVCMDCTKLITNSSVTDQLLDSLTHERVDGVEKCCAYSNNQLSALLELSIHRQHLNKAPLSTIKMSDFTYSPVSVHKMLFPPKNPHPEVEYNTRVPVFTKEAVYVLFQHENSSDDPLIEHVKGVKVMKDGLRIVHTGVYYVYSSIHFTPISPFPCKDFTYQTWNHYVEKKTPNNPAKSGCLMKTSHTCCDNCSVDKETSYTGGVFNLEANDTIHIAIGGYGLVQFNPHSSFAGLVMLGSGKH